jgi:hypothetical protein
LTRDPHQWKIWTFYLPRIPSLGGGRTNAWPRKSIWSEPTLPLFKILKYIMNDGGLQNFPFRRSYLGHRSTWKLNMARFLIYRGIVWKKIVTCLKNKTKNVPNYPILRYSLDFLNFFFFFSLIKFS